MKPSPLARRLRLLREAAGLSVWALAKRAGIASQQLYRLESGERVTVTWETAVKLARGLGVSVEAFDAAE